MMADERAYLKEAMEAYYDTNEKAWGDEGYP